MKTIKFGIAAACIFTAAFFILSGCSGSEETKKDDASSDSTATTGSSTYDYSPAFLDNYKELIGADEVKNVIDGKYPADYPTGKPFKIVEVSWGGTGSSSSYAKGHIPGAIHLDTDELEAGVVTNFPHRLPADETAAWKNTWNFYEYDRLIFLIENMGITSDTVVLVYSNSTSPACRFIIALLAMGVEDVRYIYGGYEAWTAMGYAGSTEISAYNVWANARNASLFNDASGNLDYGKFDTYYDDPATAEDESRFDMTDPNQNSPMKVNSGLTAAVHPGYIVGAGAVQLCRANPDGCKLVSIRSYGEYFGLKSGYKYIIGKGEIDGAVWGYNTDMYMNEQKMMLDPADVKAMWTTMGLTADKEIIFYCGTGWRVSFTWFYAHILGYTNVKIYDGGWYEWSEFLNPVDPETYPIQ